MKKGFKTYLLGEAEDENVNKRLANVQPEMASIRRQMQLGKDPATIVQETTKLILSMEKERADLEKKFDKALDVMLEAEESWRTAGRKVIDKNDKIQQQKDRQQ